MAPANHAKSKQINNTTTQATQDISDSFTIQDKRLKLAEEQALLPVNKIQALINTVQTGYLTSIAHGIRFHCPELVTELVKEWLESKEDSFKSLCRRYNGSVLYDKGETDVAEFNTDEIWNELVTCHPFLVDTFNRVSGSSCKADETPIFNRPKFCLAYGILMYIRWHEFSLFQRVNAFVITEATNIKKVRLLFDSNFF